MGLEIITPDPKPGRKVKLDRRLYLNAEGKVVEDGDKSAAFLLGAEGATISYDRALEVGLIDEDGKTVAPKTAEAPATAEPEQAKPRTPANKKPRTPAKNK